MIFWENIYPGHNFNKIHLKDEIDWESSMDIIKRTEQVLPETKQTEEDLVKIR